MNRHQFEQAARMFRAGRLTLADLTQQFSVAMAEAARQGRATRAEETGEGVGEQESVETPADEEPTHLPPVDVTFPATMGGYPDVIYGAGRSIKAVRQLVQQRVKAGLPVLVTQIEDAEGRLLYDQFPTGNYNAAGRTFRLDSSSRPVLGMVPIFVANAGDLPVAEEAAETLKWMGIGSQLLNDIGSDGPSRIQQRLAELGEHVVAIVVSGDGALPSLICGYLSSPVISVPTSVGSGANLGGIAALLSMLNSTVANLAVVNVDGGFKAGYLAALIASPKNHRVSN